MRYHKAFYGDFTPLCIISNTCIVEVNSEPGLKGRIVQIMLVSTFPTAHLMMLCIVASMTRINRSDILLSGSIIHYATILNKLGTGCTCKKFKLGRNGLKPTSTSW